MRQFFYLILFSILFFPLKSTAEYNPPPIIVPIVTESPILGHSYSISCYFWGNDGTTYCFTPAERDAANTDNCWTRDEGGDCKKCSHSDLTLTTLNGVEVCAEDCPQGYVLDNYDGTDGCIKCPDKYNFINGFCEWDSRYGTPPPPPNLILEVFGEGTGSGLISSSDNGINCGGDCREDYPPGTVVTLIATPAPDSYLNNFVYDENGINTCSGNTCKITMTADQQVVFIFEKKPTALYTGRSGSGNGRVFSMNSNGIDCGSDCWQNYPSATFVKLCAAPSPGSWFDSWQGTDCVLRQDPNCGYRVICEVNVTETHSAYATFTQPTLYTYNESWSQTGSGTVLGRGIACGDDCWEQYDSYPPFIDLTVAPDSGSEFAGWYGECSGMAPTCRVIWDGEDKFVGARFNKLSGPPLPDWLWVRTDTMAGTGRVTGWFTNGSPAGIDCRNGDVGVCRAPYAAYTRVTLRAEADPGSEFIGWSDNNNCPGIDDCTVTVFGIRMIWPRFRRLPRTVPPSPPGIITGPSPSNPPEVFALQTLRYGTGSGIISSSSGDLKCGAGCYNRYKAGATVTLKATPASGSVFTGWLGGGCTGTGDCKITMNTDLSIAALFDRFSLPPFISLLLLNEPKIAPGLTCDNNKIYDCANNCVSKEKALEYIGDGYCDDGTFGYDLQCDTFDNDAGDCDGTVIIFTD